MFNHWFRSIVLLTLSGAIQCAAAAYPEKPITLIVPWAPGGSTDIIARAIAEQMTKSLGQSVIVENRAGAAGNIGSNIVAKARPDGYTLLVGSMSTHAMNPALIPNMPFRGTASSSGTQLRLQLWLPDQPQPVKVELAAVQWIKNNQFGVSFLTMSPDAQARLAQVFQLFLEAQQQPEARAIHIPAFAIPGSKPGSASRGARRGFWEPMDDR